MGLLTLIYAPGGRDAVQGRKVRDSAAIYQSARQHLIQEQVLPDLLPKPQKLVRVDFGRKRSRLNTNKD